MMSKILATTLDKIMSSRSLVPKILSVMHCDETEYSDEHVIVCSYLLNFYSTCS